MNPQGTYYGQTSPELNSPSRNKRKLVLIVLVTLILVTVIIAIGSALVKPSTERAAFDFMDRVAAGDAAGSYAMLSSDAKQTTSEASWNGYVSSNKAALSGKRTVAYEKKLDGADGAEYGINIGEPGQIKRLTVVVVSEDGEEKIYSTRITPTTL